MKKLFPTRHTGFSLIEVLVAMTILSVIVLIMASVFKQTGIAWNLGARRSKAQANVRAAMGIISRDIGMAVDPNFFLPPKNSANGSSSTSAPSKETEFFKDQDFSDNNITFYILRPIDDPDDQQTTRELMKIEYSASGSNLKRKESVLRGTSWSQTSSTDFDLGSGSISFECSKSVDQQGAPSAGFQAGYITVIMKPEDPPTIDDYDIGIGSCGPDGEWGTDDDITTWPKED